MLTTESIVFASEVFLTSEDHPDMPPKRVREDSDSDSGTEVDIFKSPSKKLKPTFIVEEKEIRAFFRLFGESFSVSAHAAL